MADAIVVLNAGSSSLKFSLYHNQGKALELDLQGYIEGIHTARALFQKHPTPLSKQSNHGPRGPNWATKGPSTT